MTAAARSSSEREADPSALCVRTRVWSTWSPDRTRVHVRYVYVLRACVRIQFVADFRLADKRSKHMRSADLDRLFIAVDARAAKCAREEASASARLLTYQLEPRCGSWYSSKAVCSASTFWRAPTSCRPPKIARNFSSWHARPTFIPVDCGCHRPACVSSKAR